MRNAYLQLRYGLILCFLLIASSADAMNDQTIAFGGGIGPYIYDNDELAEVENVLKGSRYIEWYLFPDIAVGLRDHEFYKADSTSSDEELLLVCVNLTLTWIFWKNQKNLASAAYIGYGPGHVSYTNNEKQEKIDESANTGSAGFLLDWGGKRWGLRIGYHRLLASFDYTEPTYGNIDASGQGIDIGVRVGF